MMTELLLPAASLAAVAAASCKFCGLARVMPTLGATADEGVQLGGKKDTDTERHRNCIWKNVAYHK